MLEPWPKHRNGIREGYQKQPVISSLKRKWNALFTLTILQGQKTNDLWKQKRPSITVSKIDREIKLKVNVLENPPELFPELKHPAGCSLQYLIMLAEALGGADWYEAYIYRRDEADVKPAISEEKLETFLAKIAKPIHLAMERV